MPPFERAPNNSTAQRRIVIVGGVAGGASAAARARRLDENASIIVFEKGPDPSFANCGMPYHLGGEIEDRAKLNVQTPASLKARLNLDVRTLTEVLSINRDAKTVTVVEYETKRQYSEPYDDLILSVGAKPFMPPIPGIDRKGNFALRNLQDMDQIDDWLRESGAKRAVVAGAGFIGVEMAEQLKRRGLHVTLIEAAPQIMAPVDVEVAALLQQELERNGVAVRVADAVAAFEPPTDGAQGSDLLLKSGGYAPHPQHLPPPPPPLAHASIAHRLHAAAARRLHADVVILGLGVRAESALARDAGLELSARGGIVVDEHLRTKDPAIWAVGDAIEVRNPTLGDSWMVAMAGPANRQGRMVADNILAAPDTPLRAYRGTLGTSVLRCFSLTCACTGVNERTLKSRGASYKAVHTWPMSHAGYYPGAAPMLLKLLFEPASGRVLGAQAVGPDTGAPRFAPPPPGRCAAASHSSLIAAPRDAR
jgi:NADPH-dependent 2,4-dienoyl-CoA reductase/sulfur reductase-like enzyme